MSTLDAPSDVSNHLNDATTYIFTNIALSFNSDTNGFISGQRKWLNAKLHDCLLTNLNLWHNWGIPCAHPNHPFKLSTFINGCPSTPLKDIVTICLNTSEKKQSKHDCPIQWWILSQLK